MAENLVAHKEIHTHACEECQSSGGLGDLPQIHETVQKSCSREDSKAKLGSRMFWICEQIQQAKCQEGKDIFNIILVGTSNSFNVIINAYSNLELGLVCSIFTRYKVPLPESLSGSQEGLGQRVDRHETGVEGEGAK